MAVANAALRAMHGAQLGSKQVIVRLHEPKQLRQEKLAQRFGHHGHPRSASGATSPTASEGGESYVGWSSPRHHSVALGSPIGSHYERQDKGRRGSGSYYNVYRYLISHLFRFPDTPLFRLRLLVTSTYLFVTTTSPLCRLLFGKKY